MVLEKMVVQLVIGYHFFVFYFCNKFLISFWVEICELWLLALIGGCLDLFVMLFLLICGVVCTNLKGGRGTRFWREGGQVLFLEPNLN